MLELSPPRIASNAMHLSRYRPRQTAVGFQKGYRFDRRRQLIDSGLMKQHRQEFRCAFLGDGQFRQRVAAAVDRIGADQEDEKMRVLKDLAYAIVVLLPRRQIGAVEKHLMTLVAQR